METFGARCVASPSTETNSGRTILAKDPESSGSLGIAISKLSNEPHLILEQNMRLDQF